MYEPLLIARPNLDPVPRVEIRYASIDPLAVKATIWRMWSGQREKVRGAIDLDVSGGFTALDNEVPWNVNIAYQLQTFATNGTELPLVNSGNVIVKFQGDLLHNVMDPSRRVAFIAGEGTADELSEPFIGEMFQGQGAPLPLWVGSGREALSQVPLIAYLMTKQQNEDMKGIFGFRGESLIPILCWRTSKARDIPQPFYGIAKAPVRRPVNYLRGGQIARWDMELDEVAPPVAKLVRPVLTYADIEASFASYGAAETSYPGYIELESDYNLAGSGS